MWINEPRADINVLRKHDKIDKTVEACKLHFAFTSVIIMNNNNDNNNNNNNNDNNNNNSNNNNNAFA